MKNLLACILGLAMTPLHAADASLLIGKWKLSDSEGLPVSCSSAHTEFRANGTSISRSGQYISYTNYKLTPHKNGFLLEEVETSNNGKTNCQGLDSKFVQEHTPAVVYIEVSSSELRFFLLKNMTEPMFTYVRVRP